MANSVGDRLLVPVINFGESSSSSTLMVYEMKIYYKLTPSLYLRLLKQRIHRNTKKGCKYKNTKNKFVHIQILILIL